VVTECAVHGILGRSRWSAIHALAGCSDPRSVARAHRSVDVVSREQAMLALVDRWPDEGTHHLLHRLTARDP
jgi:hypothetical protein